MSYFSVKPLASWPHVEVVEVDEASGEMTPIEIEPPLIVAPTSFRVSPEAEQALFVYNMRQGQTPGLGNPNEPAPPEGLKLFSADDAYLLFGGNAGDGPTLYRRSGPTYVRLTDGPMPLPPAGSFIPHAAFSSVTHQLACVFSNDPKTVRLMERGKNKYLAGASLTGTEAVSGVWYSPGGTFLCVTTASGSTLYLAQDMSVVPLTATGTVLAISPDDQFIILDTGAPSALLRAYRYTTQADEFGTLPDTLGSWRKAAFSPDGKVLCVSTGGSNVRSPIFLAVHDEQFKVSIGYLRSGGATGSYDDVLFSRTSARMYHAVEESVSADAVVEVFEPFERSFRTFKTLPNPTPVPSVASAVSYRGDGTMIAVGGGSSGSFNALAVYLRDGDTFTDTGSGSGQQNGTLGAVAFSPLGDHIALGYSANAPAGSVELRKWDGVKYSHASRVGTVTAPIKHLAWSENGNHLAATSGLGAVNLFMYQRTGDTLAPMTTLPSRPSASAYEGVAFSADGQYFALGYRGSATIVGGVALWKKTGDTFTKLTNKTFGFSEGVTAVAFSPDGRHLAVSRTVAPFVAYFRLDGDTFTQLPDPAELPPGEVLALAFSGNGSRLAISHQGGTNVTVYERDGDTLTRIYSPSLAPTNPPTGLAYSPDGAQLVAAHGGNPALTVYKEEPPYTLPSYQRAATIPAGANLPKLWGLSPTGDLLHFGVGGVNRHVKTAAPFGDVLYVPFEGEYEARFVSDVLYSPTGRNVIWMNPDGLQAATHDYEEQYTKFSRMNGVFVSVYNRKDDRLVEKGFAVHVEGSKVSNIVFSKTPLSLSYFVAHDQGSVAVRGRHIFDTHADVLKLKGVEFEEGMVASFLAYSPFETHFAVTYQYTTKPSEIVLYRFDSQLEYEELDRELVPFGPVAYSSCEDIVVAHGGTAKPFTIYKRIETELVEQPYPEMEWQHEGLILDIAFVGNCDQLVVLTPEEVIQVDKDENGLEENDSSPTDGEGSGNQQLDPRDNGNVSVTDPDMGGIGGGGGTGGMGEWVVPPGGGLVNVVYPPYVAVHVTYRV